MASFIERVESAFDTFKPTNEVFINAKSDFPAPSGGKITLVTNTKYIIGAATIVLGTDYLDVPSGTTVSMQGQSALLSTIVYTGTGAAIRSTDSNISMTNLTFVASTIGGEVFSGSNGAKDKSFIVQESIIANSKSVGTIAGYNLILFNTINHSANVTGITINNTANLFLLDCNYLVNNTGTFVSIATGTIGNAVISRSVFSVPSGSTGLNIDTGTITITNSIQIDSNNFNGAGTNSTGFSVNELRIYSSSNFGLDDSEAVGEFYMIGNATATTIGTISTPVKAEGTTTNGDSSRFTHTNGRLTYNGLNTKKFLVMISLTFSANGNNQVIAAYVAKNGSVVTKSTSEIQGEATGDPKLAVSKCILSLATDDYIELFISNETATSSITVQDTNLTIR